MTTRKRMIAPLVLSILLVFTFLGTIIGAIGSSLLVSSALLQREITKADAAEAVYDSLESEFSAEYNTTAIPPEIYLDVLTPEYLDEKMVDVVAQGIAACQRGASGAIAVAFPEIEDAITDYFASYAAENGVEKDETYTEKLTETIESANKTILNFVDVYHFTTMSSAGILAKIAKYSTYLFIMTGVCGALTLFLVLFLLIRYHIYWAGIGLFASGAIGTGAAATILGSGVIWQFAWKEPAGYAVCTGLCFTLTHILLAIGIVLLTIGIFCICFSVFRPAPKQIQEEASIT